MKSENGAEKNKLQQHKRKTPKTARLKYRCIKVKIKIRRDKDGPNLTCYNS